MNRESSFDVNAWQAHPLYAQNKPPPIDQPFWRAPVDAETKPDQWLSVTIPFDRRMLYAFVQDKPIGLCVVDVIGTKQCERMGSSPTGLFMPEKPSAVQDPRWVVVHIYRALVHEPMPKRLVFGWQESATPTATTPGDSTN